MTFTAQALFSFSFLACVPLQQDSILVAEEIKNRHYLIFFIANKKCFYHSGCCDIYQLLSVFCILPLPCSLCILPGCVLLQIHSKKYKSAWLWDGMTEGLRQLTLTQFMFAFLISILCGEQCPGVTDENFGPAINKSATRTFVIPRISWICWGNEKDFLTVPFCTHLAGSPDVEPALPLHRRLLLSSVARWLGTMVYICKMSQTNCARKKPLSSPRAYI